MLSEIEAAAIANRFKFNDGVCSKSEGNASPCGTNVLTIILFFFWYHTPQKIPVVLIVAEHFLQ